MAVIFSSRESTPISPKVDSSSARYSVCLLDALIIDQLVALEQTSPYPSWTHVHFAEECAHEESRVLGLFDSTTLVGFIVGHTVLDEVHILNFVVATSERGKGLGKFLLNSFLTLCQNLGVAWATLEVRERNTAALSLYCAVGFIQVGLRKGYYQDNGEHALLLTLDLSSTLTNAS